ncbi:hypothetical protein G6L12_05760 [Agrobacterium rhizogenes]|nr:hypothetical protein [Rhizobium rhizogenes]NTF73980.1 hypothetical protein [Rhizobium rhizogenes]
MNTQQSTTNPSLDRLLQPIFVSLPLPKGVDGDALLRQYHYALSDQPIEALRSVVSKLVKGTWLEEVRFCPRPPELASMVRREASMIAEMNRPRVSYLPSPHQFKDWRIIHQDRARELQRQGYRLIAEGAELKARYSNVPAGTIFFWATGEMWAPPAGGIAA